MKSGIYKITNTINGKVYIGYSRNTGNRKQYHFSKLRDGTHENDHLQKAYNSYGKEAFVFEIIEHCPIEDLCKREHFWAVELKVHNRAFGYNIRPTNPTGKPAMSEETKVKLSVAHSGKVCDPKHVKKRADKIRGQKRTAEQIANLRKGQRNTPIVGFKITGELVGHYDSCQEAYEKLKIPPAAISQVLQGKNRSTYGHVFIHKKDYFPGIIISAPISNVKRLIGKFDKSGELICTYKTFIEAAKSVSGNKNSILYVVGHYENGRYPNKEYKGFIWKYLDYEL